MNFIFWLVSLSVNDIYWARIHIWCSSDSSIYDSKGSKLSYKNIIFALDTYRKIWVVVCSQYQINFSNGSLALSYLAIISYVLYWYYEK